MTQYQKDLIKQMSNEELLKQYQYFTIANSKEMALEGIKIELEAAVKAEILSRMTK